MIRFSVLQVAVFSFFVENNNRTERKEVWGCIVKDIDLILCDLAKCEILFVAFDKNSRISG